jgi:hypothetical protein
MLNFGDYGGQVVGATEMTTPKKTSIRIQFRGCVGIQWAGMVKHLHAVSKG